MRMRTRRLGRTYPPDELAWASGIAMLAGPLPLVVVASDLAWTVLGVVATVTVFLAAVLVPAIRLLSRPTRNARAGRDSEERYRRVCEMSTDLIVEEDQQGRILTINPGGAALCGYRTEDLVGRPFADLLAPGQVERLRADRARLAADPSLGSVSLEVDLTSADGTPLCVELNSAFARAGEPGTGFLSVARNVTGQRRLEAQLRQSQKMEAVGRLAGGVAHDFNNMLTVMMGFAELAQYRFDGTHPAADSLRRIVDAGHRAGALVAQLLAFSRRQVMQPATIEPVEAVRSIEPMLRSLIGATVRLEIRCAPDTGWVRVDPNQLAQVLMNLAVNARDAMPNGGVLRFETTNIVVGPGVRRGGAPVAAGSYVVLSVSDNGCGMDEATRARIFEPFFTTKPEGEGTGLGLATVYGIVKQSAGYVWVESEPGHGARFDVYLPRAFPVRTAVAAASPAAPGNGLPTRRPTSVRLAVDRGIAVKLTGSETILVAEDDGDVRDLIARALADLGYKVMAAPDGETALAVGGAGSERLDLLLTDVTLPGMSGPDLARRMCGLRPALKVLFMSGNVAPLRNGEPATVDGPLIRKPFTALLLARRVRDLFDEREGSTRQAG
jgi:two-component system, cell cycle sensor histidine kinase and response regulator CckA